MLTPNTHPSFGTDDERLNPKYFTSTPRLMLFDSHSDNPLPSPASTVASLTRELEDTLQTLDLRAAMRGQYVVKPQVLNWMWHGLEH